MPDAPTITKTYCFRVKDKHAAWLGRMARSVNFVWNYCNEVQKTAVARGNKWPSHFDLTMLATGAGVELDLIQDTIGAVCKRYVTSRRTSLRRWLRWRGRRSLGWVPIQSRTLGDGPTFRRRRIALWQHRELPEGATILDGSAFSADRRGRWYLNLVVEEPAPKSALPAKAVGVDLGLKAIVTLSDGRSFEAPQYLRKSAVRLATAQRARKKRIVATVHAKITNQRRDFLHKLSTGLVREHDTIAVGNVSSSRLARTSFAKSVLDAGWSSLRGMLRYKALAHGAVYAEVNENGSTVTCSDCGSVSGPKGRKGLVVRLWCCSACGVEHDRDVNAARNILARWASPAPTGARVA